MRIAYVYQAYSDTLRATAEAHPDHVNWEWPRYKAYLDTVNYYYRGNELSHTSLGHHCVTVPLNALTYLQSWARHLGLDARGSAEDITLRVVAHERPEVVFASPNFLHLLRRLRAELPTMRLLLLPANSPGIAQQAFKEADRVVTCIPEMAEQLSAQGLRATHLHHGFATHVLEEIASSKSSAASLPQHRELLFSGSIFRGPDFHLERERLLLLLAKRLPLTLLSSAFGALSAEAMRRLWLRRAAYVASYPLRAVPALSSALSGVPKLGEALALREFPPNPVHRSLLPLLQPAVYGLAMFERLKQSQVVLNTHINLSPVSASNMRLFEATGIGACLLTDAKSNLAELFELNSEVVAYTRAEECVEQALWLLDRPGVCAEIGARAQARVLREHTQQQRVATLSGLIQTWLA